MGDKKLEQTLHQIWYMDENKHVKTCSTLSVIREMQIKPTRIDNSAYLSEWLKLKILWTYQELQLTKLCFKYVQLILCQSYLNKTFFQVSFQDHLIYTPFVFLEQISEYLEQLSYIFPLNIILGLLNAPITRTKCCFT